MDKLQLSTLCLRRLENALFLIHFGYEDRIFFNIDVMGLLFHTLATKFGGIGEKKLKEKNFKRTANRDFLC